MGSKATQSLNPAAAATIVWFRRDLRLDDQPALADAARRGPVVPVYIHQEDELPGWALGGASRWWLHHSLTALAEALDRLGSPLVIRSGDPESNLLEIARASGADRVHFAEALEPDTQERDEGVEHTLNQGGIETERYPANLLWPIGSVLTKAGGPSQVFSPFWRAGLATGAPPKPVSAPTNLTPPGVGPRSLEVADLELLPKIRWDKQMRSRWTPGEAGARAALKAFVRDRLEDYHEGRDRLDLPGWSAMSPFIHFGEVSVRRLWHTIADTPSWDSDASREHYLREVGWREFAHHLLNHFPHTPTKPLRESFGKFPWSNDAGRLKAWQRGMTGYPVVDAAMRNLWAEGWMPNRARMIVASFLCKDLLIPWQRGAEWFWDTLVDADLASNTLGWQWTAGCGADAAPYFRVFNPVSQGEKFDPEGDYVRRWVPELARLDKRVIHKPWEAEPLELSVAGVTLGEDYPYPIVDHAKARDAALAAFERIKG